VTAVAATPEMTVEERLARIDTLLCILFGGLTSHPLANTLIPPAELAALKAMLPQTVSIDTGELT
jgi:hypothetical protein